MANTTNGVPYVTSSDYVTNYPTTSLALANFVDPIYASQKRLARVQRTSTYSSTATTVAGAANVFTSSLTFTALASTEYLVRLTGSYFQSPSNANAYFILAMTNGSSTDLGTMGIVGTGNGTYAQFANVDFTIPYTPGAGTITLNVRGYVSAGTGNVYAGSGGAGSPFPLSLSVYGPDLT